MTAALKLADTHTALLGAPFILWPISTTFETGLYLESAHVRPTTVEMFTCNNGNGKDDDDDNDGEESAQR